MSVSTLPSLKWIAPVAGSKDVMMGFQATPGGGDAPSQRLRDRRDWWTGRETRPEFASCCVMSWPEAELPMTRTFRLAWCVAER